MKKRFMSLALAVLVLLSMGSTSLFALEAEDLAPEIEDILLADRAAAESYELALDAEGNIMHNLFTDGSSLVDADSPIPYSADSSTRTYTGYIESQDEISYVPVYMTEGSIGQATLICPESADLDYNLSLCEADEDGYLTKVIQSNLQTNIDPNTGKTLDEGVSYVHNQASEGYLYVVVDSANGSSSIHPFTLIVSTDVPGSYDSHEPNDSAFQATPLTMTTTVPIRTSTTGSLNVVNDQDWYTITPSADVVVSVDAGDYKAEVYQAISGNALALADYYAGKGYYVLNKDQTYYVKVYSDASESDFTFGEYTLEITDESKYTTMATAYDLGHWLGSINNGIPIWGQSTVFYKFRIDDADKMYVRIAVPDESIVGMVALNSRGVPISDTVFSYNSSDVIIPSTGTPFLAIPIDGTQVSDGIVYIQVAYGNRKEFHPMPMCLTRVRHGSGVFQFSGTCTNPGYASSNVISLNLTTNSTIPNGCTVTRAETKGSVSPSVLGIRHMLRPASHDWLNPRSQSVVLSATYDIPDNVPVKQIWQFRYDQTAFASTKMKDITLSLEWEQDIQFENYRDR